MSTRSLGSLTLDLIARVGGFRSGMDQAARIADNRSRDIRNSVSRNVSSGFDSANGSVQEFSRNIIGLAAAWKGLQSGLAAADTWTGINNRIKLVTDGTDEFNQAQQGIIGIAKETRQSLTATAELYQRIATNQKELGLSGQEVIDIVSTISKTMVISGASANSAQGALIQLGQAFASGTLRGQELNSVLEQAPALANAIAEGMGTTVGQLRTLSQAGKLSAQAVIEALQKQAGAVDSSFSKMNATVGQSFQVLRNNATVAIGEFSEATGAANALASAVITLGNNLPIATAAFGSFAAVQVARSLSERARAMALNRVGLIASTRAELARAQAVELQTRAAMLNAQAEARRAQSIGGSVSLNAQAAAATLAHRQAVVQLTAAQVNSAAATNVLGGALRSTMAFLGGPLGIGLMIATVGASWLMFRDNTNAADRALIDLGGTVSDVTDKFRELNKQQQAGEILRVNKEAESSYKDINLQLTQMLTTIQSMGSGADFAEFANESRRLADELKSGKIGADEFSNSVAALRQRVTDGVKSHESLNNVLVSAESNLAATAREYQKNTDILGSFRGAQNDAANSVDDTTDALKRQEAALKAGQAELSKFIGDIPAKINQATVAIVRAQRGEFAAIQAEVGKMTLAAGGVANLSPQDRAALNDYLAAQQKRISAEDAARASSRSTRKTVKEERDEFKRMNEQLAERIAMFGAEGEAARLSYQLQNGELAKLTEEQKKSLMTQAEKLDAMEKEKRAQDELNEARKREVEDMLQWKSNIEDMLSDLEFEYRLLGMNNDQRETEIALRYANVDAMSEEGRMLVANIKRNIEFAKSQQELISNMDSVRSAGADFIYDWTSGAKSFKDAMTDALDSIRQQLQRMIAEKLIEQLFGQAGSAGGGAAGGFLSNLFSGYFKGGRAGGGAVLPNSLYRINETGMETISVGGRDYLMTGSDGGIVRSAKDSSGEMSSMPTKVEINVTNQSGTQMDVQSGGVQFDGEKMIINVVASAISSGKLDRTAGNAWGVRRTGFAGG